jgi:hypothetical protein
MESDNDMDIEVGSIIINKGLMLALIVRGRISVRRIMSHNHLSFSEASQLDLEISV